MKRVLLQFLTASLTMASALAEDVIVFKNGDMLRGRIVQQDEKNISFSSASVGSIKLEKSEIAEIRQETPAATAEQAENTPAAPTAPGTPAVAAVTESPEPPPAAPVAKIDPPAAKAKDNNRWSGQAGLALAMRENSDSNQSGVYKEEEFSTYRVYGQVNWKGEKNNLNWNWTYRYSEDETKKRDDYLNLSQRYNHDFKGSYYAEAKTVYQQDYKRNIDSEFLQTAELGKKWIDTSKVTFTTSVGGGYHLYTKSQPPDADSISEPKFIFDEALELKLINTLTLFEKYTHLGNLEEYHFVFSAGLENKLIMDLFLRLEYRLDRDTDTTYDNKGYYDKALLASLLFKF